MWVLTMTSVSNSSSTRLPLPSARYHSDMFLPFHNCFCFDTHMPDWH